MLRRRIAIAVCGLSLLAVVACKSKNQGAALKTEETPAAPSGGCWGTKHECVANGSGQKVQITESFCQPTVTDQGTCDQFAQLGGSGSRSFCFPNNRNDKVGQSEFRSPQWKDGQPCSGGTSRGASAGAENTASAPASADAEKDELMKKLSGNSGAGRRYESLKSELSCSAAQIQSLDAMRMSDAIGRLQAAKDAGKDCAAAVSGNTAGASGGRGTCRGTGLTETECDENGNPIAAGGGPDLGGDTTAGPKGSCQFVSGNTYHSCKDFPADRPTPGDQEACETLAQLTSGCSDCKATFATEPCSSRPEPNLKGEEQGGDTNQGGETTEGE